MLHDVQEPDDYQYNALGLDAAVDLAVLCTSIVIVV